MRIVVAGSEVSRFNRDVAWDFLLDSTRKLLRVLRLKIGYISNISIKWRYHGDTDRVDPWHLGISQPLKSLTAFPGLALS
jgi:hypothetical protein